MTAPRPSASRRARSLSVLRKDKRAIAALKRLGFFVHFVRDGRPWEDALRLYELGRVDGVRAEIARRQPESQEGGRES